MFVLQDFNFLVITRDLNVQPVAKQNTAAEVSDLTTHTHTHTTTTTTV